MLTAVDICTIPKKVGGGCLLSQETKRRTASHQAFHQVSCVGGVDAHKVQVVNVPFGQ